MTVQEPNDVDAGSVTESTLENFAALVYEKSQTSPGLKQLGLAELKNVFNYNSHKADNIAKLCGFPKDSGEDNTKYDFNGEIETPASTLSSQIEWLAKNTGVPTAEETGLVPLATRAGNLETTVGNSSSGLVKAVADNADAISDLQEQISGGGGGSSGSLTGRVAALETTVGEDDSHGLRKDVADLQTTVDDSSNGLVKKVSDLETTVDDSSNGLVKKVSDLETNVGPSDGSVAASLNGRVKKNEEDIEVLKETAASAYTFKGIADQAYVISDILPNIDNLKNGCVWNCSGGVEFWYPQEGQSEAHKYTFEDGMNFALVKTEGQVAKFDALGATTDISGLQSDVDELKKKFIKGNLQSNSWDSTGLTGMYLISGVLNDSGTNKNFAFIHFFNNGLAQNAVVDLSGAFNNNYFEINLSGFVASKKPITQISALNLNAIAGA